METELKMELDQLDKKVDTILHLLQGNEMDRETGLVHQVKTLKKDNEDLEKRVEKLEMFKHRIIWVSVGLALPTTYGAASLLYQFFKAITGK